MAASPSRNSTTSPRRLFTLDDIDKTPTSPRSAAGGFRVSSPISLEVCRRFGIDPSELVPRPVEAFQFSPSRPGLSGELQEALMKRRHEHNEEKRRQKIAFLRNEREQLIQSGGLQSPQSVPLSPRSPPRTPRAASRVSQQNTDMQKTNYQLLMARRREWAALKTARLEEALSKVNQNKAKQLGAVADVGARGFEQAMALKDHAARLSQSRQEELALKEEQKSFQRDLKCQNVDTERLGKSLERQESTRTRLRQAQDRCAEVTSKVHEQRAGHWDTVELEAQRCRERHDFSNMTKEQLAAAHFDQVKSVHDQARAMETAEQMEKRLKLEEKERQDNEVLYRQKLAEAVKLQEEAIKAESHEQEVRMQAQMHLIQTTLTKAGKAQQKHQRFGHSRNQKVSEEAWNAELKREAVEDHIDEVKRSRRSREYDRLQHMQAVVNQTYSKPSLQ